MGGKLKQPEELVSEYFERVGPAAKQTKATTA